MFFWVTYQCPSVICSLTPFSCVVSTVLLTCFSVAHFIELLLCRDYQDLVPGKQVQRFITFQSIYRHLWQQEQNTAPAGLDTAVFPRVGSPAASSFPSHPFSAAPTRKSGQEPHLLRAKLGNPTFCAPLASVLPVPWAELVLVSPHTALPRIGYCVFALQAKTHSPSGTNCVLLVLCFPTTDLARCTLFEWMPD